MIKKNTIQKSQEKNAAIKKKVDADENDIINKNNKVTKKITNNKITKDSTPNKTGTSAKKIAVKTEPIQKKNIKTVTKKNTVKTEPIQKKNVKTVTKKNTLTKTNTIKKNATKVSKAVPKKNKSKIISVNRKNSYSSDSDKSSDNNSDNDSDNESNNESDNDDYESEDDLSQDMREEINNINKKIKNQGKKTNSNKNVDYNRNLLKNHESKHDLEIRTTQTLAIKQMFERIATVISTCNILFKRPDDDENNYAMDDYYEEIDNKKGKKRINNNKNNKKNKKIDEKSKGYMKIIKISECGSILVHLALDSKNFDYFHCSSPTMMISVDITNLNNKLQLITGEDPIVIYMSKDNRSVLYIKSSTEGNGAGGEESSIELALMEEEYVEMKIPKTEFISMITIKSNDFHNMCKKIQNNTHVVEIIMVGDRITFRGNDEGGKLQKTFIDNSCKNNDDDDEDNANQDGKLQKKKDKIVKVDNEIVQGKFNLKSITGFSKCNKLSETITIYMKNNYPLLLCIEVSALGKLYVFLTPVEDDQKDN